jgi:RHS repeat-associated protein
MVTDQNAHVVARHDFLPFGEEIPGGWAGRSSLWGASDGVYEKFTGQTRDAETGLDFFQARYYGSALGRFTSPDPGNAGADQLNPQSWNAYAYVLNNPLLYTDPTGNDITYGGDPYTCVDNPPPPPQDPWAPGGSLFQLWRDSLSNAAQQAGQQMQQAAQQAFNWLSAPRDPNCVTAHTMGGAGSGMAGGALFGSFFGPGDVLTVPAAATAGYLGGAALGRVGGLISCMSGAGSSGGAAPAGGGGGSPLRRLYDSLRSLSGLGREQRIAAIENTLNQIERTNPGWHFINEGEIDGVHVFMGARGEAIFVDEGGAVWRGSMNGLRNGDLGTLLLK